jgi:HPt (histidine-containing phosphotransfer) domain-containing protein
MPELKDHSQKSPADVSLQHLAEQGIDGEAAGEIIQSFMEIMPGMLRDLDAAIQSHDAAGIKRVAHSIRGGCGNLGLLPVVATLRNLEIAANDASASASLQQLCKEVQSHYDAFVDSVKTPVGGEKVG